MWGDASGCRFCGYDLGYASYEVVYEDVVLFVGGAESDVLSECEVDLY